LKLFFSFLWEGLIAAFTLSQPFSPSFPVDALIGLFDIDKLLKELPARGGDPLFIIILIVILFFISPPGEA